MMTTLMMLNRQWWCGDNAADADVGDDGGASGDNDEDIEEDNDYDNAADEVGDSLKKRFDMDLRK